MYIAFAYEENTQNKICECFANDRKTVVDMFFERAKGLNTVGFVYEVDSNLKPVEGLGLLLCATADD